MRSSNAITRIRRLLISKKVITFLICLSIASLLWVVHALNINYKYIVTVPVAFLNLPSNKLIVGELPESLNVEIKASGLKLLFISLKKTIGEVVIDFNSLKTNSKSNAYAISNGNFNLRNALNFDVEIIKIRPDTLFFSAYKGTSKLLPVKANLKVSCLPGYSVISKPSIIPAYVTVTGDSLDLKKIDTAKPSVRSHLKSQASSSCDQCMLNQKKPVRLQKSDSLHMLDLGHSPMVLESSIWEYQLVAVHSHH